MVFTKHTFTRLFILWIILALTLTACGGGGVVVENGRSGSPGGVSTDRQSINPDATATFGANEWRVQLTAIAGIEKTPTPP